MGQTWGCLGVDGRSADSKHIVSEIVYLLLLFLEDGRLAGNSARGAQRRKMRRRTEQTSSVLRTHKDSGGFMQTRVPHLERWPLSPGIGPRNLKLTWPWALHWPKAC